jgi:radical SAM superfamily enzyme YgiQ (UPF0313 family)
VDVIKPLAATAKRAQPNCRTLDGGVYAEVCPGEFKDEAIDIVADGMEVFRGLIAKNPRKEGLPYPERAATARYRNRYNYVFHSQCATIKTSYGCPYKCEFCFCIAITGGAYHSRPLDEVMQELQKIEEKSVFIVDDNFMASRERIIEFCRLLDKYQIQKNYILFGRADFIADNPDMIDLLKAHGVKSVFTGLESFREEELRDLNKKAGVESNIKAVQVLESRGMECYAGIITGEDWDKADFDNLIKYLNSFEHPFVNIQPLTPMPGTAYYKKREGESQGGVHPEAGSYYKWDMAHLLFEPKKMSRRRYYWHILRAYRLTMLQARVRRYIRERYGRAVYLRTASGALSIALQYIKLIITGG